MEWINRTKTVKITLIVVAVLIGVASLVFSNYLVRELSKEEERRMEVWTEAMRTFNNADEDTDLNLVLTVIKGNNEDFIKNGNTLSDDQFAGQTFDYIISNPPFG